MIENLPFCIPGLDREVYGMFEEAMINNGINSVEEALKAVKGQEISEAKKRSADKIANYLREALVGV